MKYVVILIQQCEKETVKLLRSESINVPSDPRAEELCDFLYIGVLECRRAAAVRTCHRKPTISEKSRETFL